MSSDLMLDRSIVTFVAQLHGRLGEVHDSNKAFLWSQAELLNELSRPDVWGGFLSAGSNFSFFEGTNFAPLSLGGDIGGLKSFVLFRRTDRFLFDLMFVASLELHTGKAKAVLQRSLQAIGSKLLKQSKLESQPIQILLEVRRSNRAAIEFYKSFGFEQIAVRKDYYSLIESDDLGKKNPREDALVMRYQLGEGVVRG